MNCGHMEKKLVAYLDGNLAIAERRQMEAHLTICTACQERAAEFRSVTAIICVDSQCGLISVVTPAFCFRKPRHSRRQGGCEAISQPKTWLKNRRNGSSAAILSPPV